MKQDYTTEYARKKMMEHLLHGDAAETFEDKMKAFAKKCEVAEERRHTWGNDYEKKRIEFYALPDEKKKQYIIKAETDFTKKFTDAFGADKGGEMAKKVIGTMWDQYKPRPREKRGILFPRNAPFGIGNTEEEEEEDIVDIDSESYTGGRPFCYITDLNNRTETFGKDDNVMICTEVQKAIKKKYGAEVAKKYVETMAKLYKAAVEYVQCRSDVGCRAQGLLSIQIYKGLGKNDKKWLEDYLDKIAIECDDAMATQKEKDRQWKEWMKDHH